MAGMAAAASMASLASTSCLPQRLSASRARQQTSCRVGLGSRASAGVVNCQRLADSSFSGIQLPVRTAASVRKQSFGLAIRAAGAKGDYLVVNPASLSEFSLVRILSEWLDGLVSVCVVCVGVELFFVDCSERYLHVN